MRKIFSATVLIATSIVGILLLSSCGGSARTSYINASANYTEAFSNYDKYPDNTDSGNSISDLSSLYTDTYKTYLVFKKELLALPLTKTPANGLPSREIAIAYTDAIGKYLLAKADYLSIRRNCYAKDTNKKVIECLGYARGAMIVDNSDKGIFTTRKALNLIKIEFNHETNQ
jgi:hypothetical protein